MIDLSGQTFGKLAVISRESNRYLPSGQTEPMWKCICSCGNIVIIRGKCLRAGTTKSCGCLAHDGGHRKIKVGDIFDRIKILRFERSTGRETWWLCECSCGNSITLRGSNLLSGNTKSCGCYQKETARVRAIKDMTGKRFGQLTVLEKDKVLDVSRQVRWICMCDCGNKISVIGSYLRRGTTSSCGCRGLQSKIAKNLKEYFSLYYGAISEYKIIKNPKTGYWLPFDIYIPDNIFVEIHGLQHYEHVRFFHPLRKNFMNRQILDKYKKDFAEGYGTYIEIDLRKIKTVEDAIVYIEERL